ncbi:NAD(P)-dependent oxidoreductase [Sphingobacterium sp. C459-1T]|uniref:NAD(P)-dependent oxidoreductase n=2 Tax=Sphingobacterium faecale TaxID=2803775 RepID=A0ABS1QXH6_9SPHI|nr:NAD(P)-dependent oxidoreductase [Sphingobacterium faecale]MBL1407131.1 NAD(P)-dependent oxidoreductase [Sphingobacterium faecale]
MENIGFIGLGNMGYPMAKNLEKAGFPLTVYNRTTSRTAGFAEQSAISPDIEGLVATNDIVFTMLTNDAAVSAVYEVVMKQDIKGKLFVDMSTISQKLSQQLAMRIRENGGAFVDAPVAGSTMPAKEGTLIIMAGGEDADVVRAMPYFERMGKLTKHVGANGQGIAAKLSINYFLSILYQGLAETVLFSGSLGVSREDMLEIINESASGSGATKVKTPLLLKDDYSPAFALDLMLKDVLLAQEAGADYPLTRPLLDTYNAAQQAGLGEKDVIAVIDYIKAK